MRFGGGVSDSISHLSRNFLAKIREVAKQVLEIAEKRRKSETVWDSSGNHSIFLKTVWGQPHMGSNPIPSVKAPERLCVRVLFIQHSITHRRVFSFTMMIFTTLRVGDIHVLGVIRTQKSKLLFTNRMFYNKFIKMYLKSIVSV